MIRLLCMQLLNKNLTTWETRFGWKGERYFRRVGEIGREVKVNKCYAKIFELFDDSSEVCDANESFLG